MLTFLKIFFIKRNDCTLERIFLLKKAHAVERILQNHVFAKFRNFILKFITTQCFSLAKNTIKL